MESLRKLNLQIDERLKQEGAKPEEVKRELKII